MKIEKGSKDVKTLNGYEKFEKSLKKHPAKLKKLILSMIKMN